MTAVYPQRCVLSMQVPACCGLSARCQNMFVRMVTMEQPPIQRLKSRRLQLHNDVFKHPSFHNLSNAHSRTLPEVRSRIRAGAEGTQDMAVLSEGGDLSKLVEEAKVRLASEYADLKVGRGGRDDEELLLWFLKDRKYNVEAAVPKVARFIKWRSEFGVDGITPEMIASEVASGKARLHAHLDVRGHPVIIVTAANHIGVNDPLPSQRLCVSLVEGALARLPGGEDQLLGIFDLRGFGPKNADLVWVKFFVDIFFNYYPKRLSAVLFVDAPFVFQPGWAVIKPLLKSYASLVKFVTAEQVATQYFTPDTLPESFKRKE